MDMENGDQILNGDVYIPKILGGGLITLTIPPLFTPLTCSQF